MKQRKQSRKVLAMLCASALTSVITSQSKAQSADQAPASLTGATLPAPVLAAATGIRSDKSALSEIAQYEALTLHPSASAMTATGTVTLGSSADAKTYDAQMTVSQGNRFRLDVQSPHRDSLRVAGAKASRGTAQGGEKLVRLGFFGESFVFPDALKNLVADPSVSIVDDGQVTVDGRTLHKISLSRLAKATPQATGSGDLYFDSNTHVLAFSAAKTRVEGRAVAPMTRVIEYRSYSPEDGVMVAHQFTEINGGSVGFTFQVKQVSFSSTADNSQFHF